MTELKSRSEMAKAWLNTKWPANYLEYEASLVNLLARRDEMVIEACAKVVEGEELDYPEEAIRALKGKLR